MKNKSLGILIGVSVATLITYIIAKKMSQNKSSKSKLSYLIHEGDKYYKEKDYATAILFYTRCLTLTDDNNLLLELYNNLSYCNIKIKEYKESINYLDKSLSISVINNHKAIKWRGECYKLLGMTREYLKDLLLYYSVMKDENIKKQGETVMKNICEDETDEIYNTKWVKLNDIEYKDINNTLISLIEEYEESAIVQLVKEGRYNELDEMIRDGYKKRNNTTGNEDQTFEIATENCNAKTEPNKSKSVQEDICKSKSDVSSETKKDKRHGKYKTSAHAENQPGKNANTTENKDVELNDKTEFEIYTLLKALVLFHKGRVNESLCLLAKSTFKYSMVVRDFINSCKMDQKVHHTLQHTTNITCLYYAYKASGDIQYLEKALSVIDSSKYDIKYDFVYQSIILNYIDHEYYDKIDQLVTRMDVQSSPLLVELMTEYYIKFKEISKAEDILSTKMSDPRINLARALYCIETGKKDQAQKILNETIKMHPDFYKAYLYLGNLLFHENFVESRKVFEQSLEFCASYDEIYMTKQALLLVDVQEHIKNWLG